MPSYSNGAYSCQRLTKLYSLFKYAFTYQCGFSIRLLLLASTQTVLTRNLCLYVAMGLQYCLDVTSMLQNCISSELMPSSINGVTEFTYSWNLVTKLYRLVSYVLTVFNYWFHSIDSELMINITIVLQYWLTVACE